MSGFQILFQNILEQTRVVRLLLVFNNNTRVWIGKSVTNFENRNKSVKVPICKLLN